MPTITGQPTPRHGARLRSASPRRAAFRDLDVGGGEDMLLRRRFENALPHAASGSAAMGSLVLGPGMRSFRGLFGMGAFRMSCPRAAQRRRKARMSSWDVESMNCETKPMIAG